jgi:succinoglycan biosynthesis protein ExoA
VTAVPEPDPASATRPESDAATDPRTPVSVVMPVLDEEAHLAEAVRRILDQEYAGEMEVVLAVGPSRDRTEEIAAALAAADPRVSVVPNPSGRTPDALNAAIAASRHDVVVRVDGHGHLPSDYVREAVRLLERTGADNVGGMMVPVGRTPFEQAVARAMSSWIGIGGERFHLGGEEGPATTVYLGVFRRSVFDRLGGFDPRFSRAQDWELNHRIRRSGGTVWFSPRLQVTYRPRPHVRPLARQFYRTGRWRRQVQRTYPETVSARYLAPPAAVLAMGTGALVGVAGLVAGAPLVAAAGLAVPVGYVVAVTATGAVVARDLPLPARVRFPLVVAVMHVCWGAGYLRGPEPPDHRAG